VMEAVFKDEDEDGPLLARSVRAMLASDGEGRADVVADAWRDQKATAEQEAGAAERKAKGLAAATRPPSSAVAAPTGSRPRRTWTGSSATRPTSSAGSTRPWIASVTSRRPAEPSRPEAPSVAVVQAGPGEVRAGPMGPFGSFALEATDKVQEPAGVDAGSGDNR
jgi:hypothetical protein